MRKLKPVLLALLFLVFVGLGIHTITRTHNTLKIKDIQLKSTTTDLLDLQVKYDLLNDNLKKEIDSKDHNQDKIKQLEDEKKKLEDERNKLQQDLQAKAKAKEEAAQRIAQAASLSGQQAFAASGNYAKDYIYAHESGNCPTKWQGQHTCPSGYIALFDPSTPGVGYGLCQSTPAIKMADVSRGGGPDWMTNYATQDSWCTYYANSRYGGWEQAYNHWLVYHSW